MAIWQRNKWWFFLVVLIGALALGSWTWMKHRDTSGIRIGEVVKGDMIQRVTIAGNVIPDRRTIITAPYAGYIKQIFVKVGQNVKRGDPLVSVVQSLTTPDTVFPLRAPYDGTVVQLLKSEGEFVTSNDAKDYIMRIDDLQRLFVQAKAPEFDMVKIKIGQEAVVKSTSILNRSYKGQIRELSLAALEKDRWSNSQLVEYPLRIEIMDADAQLKPGMSVLVDVIALKKEGVLLLDHEFIAQDGSGYFVTMASGDRRVIKTGVRNEQAFEVIEGLRAGDRVRQIDFMSLIEAK